MFQKLFKKKKAITKCIVLIVHFLWILFGGTSMYYLNRNSETFRQSNHDRKTLVNSPSLNLTLSQKNLLITLLTSSSSPRECVVQQPLSFWIYQASSMLLLTDSRSSCILETISHADKLFDIIFILLGFPACFSSIYFLSTRLLRFINENNLSQYFSTKREMKTNFSMLICLCLFVLSNCIFAGLEIATTARKDIVYSDTLYKWILYSTSVGSRKIEDITSFNGQPIIFLISQFISLTIFVSLVMSMNEFLVNLQNYISKVYSLRSRKYNIPQSTSQRSQDLFYINEGVTKDKFHTPSVIISLQQKLSAAKSDISLFDMDERKLKDEESSPSSENCDLPTIQLQNCDT